MRYGQIKLVIKDNIFKVKKKDMEYLDGLINLIMKENLWIILFMEWVHMYGEMEECM
jgi:hypothetical protein